MYDLREGIALRILVTGGAGFIGSHLCERLVRDGHAVAALDNLATCARENLSGISENPAFRFVLHDVEDRFESPYGEEGRLDRIYHLACPASPQLYQADPLRTLRTCVLGTLHALELAQKTGARFLLASTSEVYGDPAVHPQHEGYWGNVNPIGPRACYDEGKRCAETFTMEFRAVDTRIARIFNTYGPRMVPGDGRVVLTFIDQALRGEDVTVFGDGTQTRSFCYVDDLVDGLVRLMEHEEARTPVNLGNPEEVSMIELAKSIVRLTKSSSRITTRPLPTDDPKRRCPDISIARRLLGFAPGVRLAEGLEKTIADARRRDSVRAVIRGNAAS